MDERSEKNEKRQEMEVQILSNTCHPNVLKLKETLRDCKHKLWLITELCDGTWSNFVKDKKYNMKERPWYLRDGFV